MEALEYTESWLPLTKWFFMCTNRGYPRFLKHCRVIRIPCMQANQRQS